MITVLFITLSGVLTTLVIVIGWRLRRSLLLFRTRKPYTAAIEPPSVSVCIPARNETHAMSDCLESILASDYKKMEIIVVDDESEDDTSHLIRSFAHSGVRFIPGSKLPEQWLGKNHALELLAKEASGTYVIFMDVDTRVKPDTISRLLSYAITGKLDMVSVIPRRQDFWRASVFLSPLRYFWQLVMSNESHPANASSLWLIKRDVLMKEHDGFTPIKSDAQPEATLSAALGTKRYHCLLSDEDLGLSYEKKWSSQVETSRRLLYPSIGGTWKRALVALVILIFLNVPLFILLLTPLTGWTEYQILALWISASFMGIYAVYTAHVWRARWWIGGLLWPVVVLQELFIFVSSLIGYARRSITWKGRPVVIASQSQKG